MSTVEQYSLITYFSAIGHMLLYTVVRGLQLFNYCWVKASGIALTNIEAIRYCSILANHL